jgi:hypothetical protein
MVQGPLKTFGTAGADLFGFENGEHTFIDIESVFFCLRPMKRLTGLKPIILYINILP